LVKQLSLLAPIIEGPKPRCSRCGREAKTIDRDEGQCERCNAAWLHEVCRLALIASLDPEAARLYMRDGE
jgi:predicted amidophosphoribosyltransferase